MYEKNAGGIMTLDKNKKNTIATVILALFIFSFLGLSLYAQEDDLKLQPYLQAVTETSIYVLVETENTDPVFAEYKTSSEIPKIAKSSFYKETEDRRRSNYIHRIMLSDLHTNTQYSYRVFAGNDTTDSFNFTTAVKPGTPYRFAVTGDMRSNPDIFSNVCGDIQEYSPRFSIYTGDLCYNSEYYSWKNEFFIPKHMDLIAEVPFYNAVGNHEDWDHNTEAFLQAPDSPSGHQAYYSFDYGDVHFLIISTEHGVGRNSDQWKFAVEDLKNNKSKWKVVVFHIPAYCGGGHGENKNMKRMTTEIFEPYGVNFILNGHSHFYQHNRVNGIRHLILAGGGAPLYSPKKADYTIKMKKIHHYAICDVSADEFKITVYDLSGNIIDTIIEK
jgi:hypothetical protein